MKQNNKTYSVPEGCVYADNCPIDSTIPEQHNNIPEPSSPGTNNHNSTVPLDYTRFINEISSKSRPSHLREIYNMVQNLPSHSIKFGIGAPNVVTIPFKNISVELTTGENIEIQSDELSEALQYLPSKGYKPLLNVLEGIQDRFHGSQNWQNRTIMITSGGQEGLSLAVDMCLSRGDPVILPDPIYTGAIDLFIPYDPDIISIKQDSCGVVVEEIEKKLTERKKNKQPMPKLIYLNPTASNPAGTSLPTHRKREIYRLACEHNMLILEDDPYYYLHFEKEDPVSFLSMDTQGRVLRSDSFSKIMSSGIRVGFMTGPTALLRRMELQVQTSTIHTSSVMQVMIYKLLSQWGIDGLTSHFMHVRNFYKQKRDRMMLAVRNHLDGLAEWTEPTGGMFLWLKIIGLDDTKRLVTSRCLDKLVILAPGYALSVDPVKPSPYIRLSYSLASPDQVDRGISLLAEAIREELQLLSE